MSFRNTKTPRKPDNPGKWQIPMRPHPKYGVMEYYLEGELKERFCKLFPKHSNRRLMDWFGVSFSTLQRFARANGLKKIMTAIRRELARDVKKICEKNGYYDSLRGRRPSEQCMEATRKLRADGFHPLRQLKKKNPRKYKRLQKKKSEQRKQLIRRERLRLLYGMEQNTKLHLPINPLSSAATSQKYAMIRNNNYFAYPGHPSWVCYDSETRRSARRETTAIRHGLRIVEGEDEPKDENISETPNTL